MTVLNTIATIAQKSKILSYSYPYVFYFLPIDNKHYSISMYQKLRMQIFFSKVF